MIAESRVAMGTVVTIRVVREEARAREAVARAFSWFHEVEERCTRFDPRSELMQLTARAGTAVPVSAILFEAVRFAVLVAGETGGAFDPTVGQRMEALGYNREHRTGAVIQSDGVADVSHLDVELDAEHRTICLRTRLTLDLGAVAKGLAVDAAARELEALRDFSIDAGGDLYLGGLNADGEPWLVGIRHPRQDGELIGTVRVSNKAVCTSGDYEKGQHILDGRGLVSPRRVVSATVVAAGAMLADALATAAFVMGPEEGIELLNRMSVDGLMVTPELERFETEGWRALA